MHTGCCLRVWSGCWALWLRAGLRQTNGPTGSPGCAGRWPSTVRRSTAGPQAGLLTMPFFSVGRCRVHRGRRWATQQGNGENGAELVAMLPACGGGGLAVEECNLGGGVTVQCRCSVWRDLTHGWVWGFFISLHGSWWHRQQQGVPRDREAVLLMVGYVAGGGGGEGRRRCAA